jgi:hypothetical protein
VVRTPNGNDYGKDLLRQHYLQRHAADTCFRLNSLTLFPADVDPHDW